MNLQGVDEQQIESELEMLKVEMKAYQSRLKAP